MPDALLPDELLALATTMAPDAVEKEMVEAYHDVTKFASKSVERALDFARYAEVRKLQVGHGHWQEQKEEICKRLKLSPSTVEHYMTFRTQLLDMPDLRAKVVTMSQRAAMMFVRTEKKRRDNRRQRTLVDAANEIKVHVGEIGEVLRDIRGRYDDDEFGEWLESLGITIEDAECYMNALDTESGNLLSSLPKTNITHS